MNSSGKLILNETRMFLREPVGVFFALAFPSILVVILGSVKSFRSPSADLGGLRVIDLYVTIAVTLVIAMIAVTSLPSILASYREKGVLRRLSTTPVHPAMLLVAHLVVSLAIGLISVILVMGIGRAVFDVPLPRQLGGFILALVLAAAALLAIGLFVAAVAPNAKAGNAIGVILFFPLMFFAGLWAPRESMPPMLQHIGDYTPLGAGEHALHEATMGSWPQAGTLGVLVAYLVVFGLAAARLFRWE
jgi:ABC-2 type transport system permease protein